MVALIDNETEDLEQDEEPVSLEQLLGPLLWGAIFDE